MHPRIRALPQKIGRYCSLYGAFVRNCLMAQMEYRLNFLYSVLVECGYLFVKVMYVVVVFGAGVKINGMSPYEILMCIGMYTVITGVMDTVFYPNVAKLPELIRTGDLDFYVTKPVSLQFMISLRYFDLGLAVPNLIGGLVMIVVAWQNLNIPADPGRLAGFIFFAVVGLCITYPILMIPSILSFWFVKTDQLFAIIWSVWDFNNMPMGIYNRVIQNIGIFLIPIFIINNFGPMFVIGKLAPLYIFWSVLASVLLLVFLRVLLRVAVRHYSSASS